MRILSILFFISLGLFTKVSAQVDILNARADPKTFIFDDEKHTVHGYIYNTLKEKTSCCGNDAVYLEVKFDQTGTVTSAKTLTGKNDCYKKSIVDIVYGVKWKAEGVSGTKTIYFEVKPIVPCSGSPGENVYKNVMGAPVAVNTPPVKEVVEEVVEVVEETPVVEEEVEEVVEEVVEAPAVEDEFLSNETSEETVVEETVEVTKEVIKVEAPKSGKDAIKENAVVKSGKEVIKETAAPKEVVKPTPAPVKTQPTVVNNSKPSGPIKIPPQEKLPYVSKGDVKPDESHNTTFVNNEPIQSKEVKYDNESQVAVNMRTELRKAGYCGLAHAVIEMETDPRTGNVISTRVLKSNDPKVAELVPTVTKSLRFKPSAGASNRYVYTEFKTEMVCTGGNPTVDLDSVEKYLVKPEVK